MPVGSAFVEFSRRLEAATAAGGKNAAARGAWPAELKMAALPPHAALTPAILELLQSARQALPDSQEDARHYIARAAMLLRAGAGGQAGAEEAGGQPPCGGLAPWQLSRVVLFIDANLTRTIRIKEIAADIHLSCSYFYQAFRRSVGESPYAFILRRRIQRVQNLMLQTDKPLSQIALDCGLADQPHLTRQFRQIVGVSPAAWRRRWGGVAERRDVACGRMRGTPPGA